MFSNLSPCYARHGKARHGKERHGKERHGKVMHGMTWKGKAKHGDLRGSKMENIQSPQISAKTTPSRSSHHKLSNDANETSNGVRMKKLWLVKVGSQP
jgi:hypothetical protein